MVASRPKSQRSALSIVLFPRVIVPFPAGGGGEFSRCVAPALLLLLLLSLILRLPHTMPPMVRSGCCTSVLSESYSCTEPICFTACLDSTHLRSLAPLVAWRVSSPAKAWSRSYARVRVFRSQVDVCLWQGSVWVCVQSMCWYFVFVLVSSLSRDPRSNQFCRIAGYPGTPVRKYDPRSDFLGQAIAPSPSTTLLTSLYKLFYISHHKRPGSASKISELEASSTQRHTGARGGAIGGQRNKVCTSAMTNREQEESSHLACSTSVM